ncbi:MAG TPA: flagellar biosynthetic protein FliO [Pyrinomonadaceae bacterium]|nr:flagellar biosynthetic protein FliO [Pyrinomonadaceae bacterium]
MQLVLLDHGLSKGLWATMIWQADEIKPEQFQSGSSLLWTFLQTIVALGFVCLLAYVLLRYVLPRVNVASNSKSMVRVVDRVPVDQKRSLYVVEVTGRWLLLGSSETGMNLISELDPEKAQAEIAARQAAATSARSNSPLENARAAVQTTFSDVLARVNKRR